MTPALGGDLVLGVGLMPLIQRSNDAKPWRSRTWSPLGEEHDARNPCGGRQRVMFITRRVEALAIRPGPAPAVAAAPGVRGCARR